MNIDAYYARSGGQPQMPFEQPPTYPTAMPQPNYSTKMAGYQQASPEQMFPRLSEEDRMRLMTAINSGNAPDAVQQAQRDQRMASDWMAQNMPKPELGPINRQTYNDINQIYYRHYVNGTYGSPEMFNELQSYMDTIRQQQAATPRPTPEGRPVTSTYMGMGWQGTPVQETSYVPTTPAAPVAPATPPSANMEARLRELLARAGRSLPTRGGPGGLPGSR